MPFKTFTPGVLTSSDVNTFLMQQAVITCTSTTRPAAPTVGMTIFETDTTAYAYWTGSVWQYQGRYLNFTPSVTNFTLGNGLIETRYVILGSLVHYRGALTWGSTTALSATSMNISLPVPNLTGALSGVNTGVAQLVDDSTSQAFSGMARVAAQVLLIEPFFVSGTGIQNAGYNSSGTLPFSFTTDDSIRWSVLYEAA
jgi:hypothetical protein